MSLRAILAAGFCLAPGLAQAADLTCSFTTLCTGQEACAPPDADTVIRLSTDTGGMSVDMDGDVFRMALAGPAEADPVTYFDDEDEEDGGGIMISLFDDGTIAMTIHASILGPFAATAFGTCTEAAE